VIRSTERSTRPCRGSASATRDDATHSLESIRLTKVVANSLTTSWPTPPDDRHVLTLVRNGQGPWCFSLRVAQSFGVVRRRTRNIVGPVTTVPPRIAFPMRKSAEGAFRKGHGPSRQSSWMRSEPQALDSHPPRATLPTTSSPSPRPGMRTALAGAVRHPSTHETDWTSDPRRRRVGPTTATRHRAQESPATVFRLSECAEESDGLETESFHPPA
jgi:hypothetical protein